MERTMEEKKLAEKYRKLEEEAKRNHYLISTKMIPGVYNSPFYPYVYRIYLFIFLFLKSKTYYLFL